MYILSQREDYTVECFVSHVYQYASFFILTDILALTKMQHEIYKLILAFCALPLAKTLNPFTFSYEMLYNFFLLLIIFFSHYDVSNFYLNLSLFRF